MTRIEVIERADGRWGFSLYAPDGDDSADAISTRSYESEGAARLAAYEVLEMKARADVMTARDSAERECGRLRHECERWFWRCIAAAAAAAATGAAVAAIVGGLI